MKPLQNHGRRAKKSRKRVAKSLKGKQDISTIQEEIKNLVCSAAIEMVGCTIEEVKKGHYSAMKFLFEMVGLHLGAEANPADPEANMTAETLCQRLGIPVGPEPQVTNGPQPAPAIAIDAVE